MFKRNASKNIELISISRPEGGSYETDFKHMHFSNEILLFYKGNAKYMIDGEVYVLKPYDLLIIPKGTYHYMISDAAVKHVVNLVNFYDDLLPECVLKRLIAPPHIFNIRNDPFVISFFNLLEYAFVNYNKEEFEYSVEVILKDLLTYCSYVPRSSFSIAASNPLIEKILVYISSHIEDKLDANVISENINMSSSHIQNTFSEHMKMGLKQYITEKKIIAAHGDLMAGVPATEVAMKYNFNDYSTFWRLYKKSFGVPPSFCKAKKNNTFSGV